MSTDPKLERPRPKPFASRKDLAKCSAITAANFMERGMYKEAMMELEASARCLHESLSEVPVTEPDRVQKPAWALWVEVGQYVPATVIVRATTLAKLDPHTIVADDVTIELPWQFTINSPTNEEVK